MTGRVQPAAAVLDADGVCGLVRPINAAEWDAYVATHRDATAYHHWGWRHVFRRGVRPPLALPGRAAKRPSHRRAAAGRVPIAPVRRVRCVAAVRQLRRRRGRRRRGRRGARGRGRELGAHARRSRTSSCGICRRMRRRAGKRHKVAMWLPLAGRPALWRRSIGRSAIRCARRRRRARRPTGGAELLDEFYASSRATCAIWARRSTSVLLRDDPSRLSRARARLRRATRATPGRGVDHVRWRDTVEVPWASSLREHSDMSPNMLLYWTMLKRDQTGASRFDFGRSTPDEGTFQFKRQWGAEPHPLVWEYAGLAGALPDQSPANPKFRLAISMLAAAAVAVANRIGPPSSATFPDRHHAPRRSRGLRDAQSTCRPPSARRSSSSSTPRRSSTGPRPSREQSTSVTAMQHIGRAQQLFDRFGIKPTYVIDYPVAIAADGSAPLAEFAAAGRATIGAHLHPWVTPPHDEEVTRANSFALTSRPRSKPRSWRRCVETIDTGLRRRPQIYKAGRYGIRRDARDAGRARASRRHQRQPAHGLHARGGPGLPAVRCAAVAVRASALLEMPCTTGSSGSRDGLAVAACTALRLASAAAAASGRHPGAAAA